MPQIRVNLLLDSNSLGTKKKQTARIITSYCNRNDNKNDNDNDDDNNNNDDDDDDHNNNDGVLMVRLQVSMRHQTLIHQLKV